MGVDRIRKNVFFGFRAEFFAFLAAAARRGENCVFEDERFAYIKQPNSKVSGAISEAPRRPVFIIGGGFLAPVSEKRYEFGPF